MTGSIEHVTDTAFWVASDRALEGERPDALFRDPLAAVLAGEKGRRIAESMPNHRAMVFVMALRTTAIDRLIASAIERGADTVLNLGAGLDTRPYRLQLPASLRWVEADFQSVIEHKNDKLAGERPSCALERVAIDLADRAERQALLRRVANSSSSVLVLTEGVIIYLHDDEVTRLAEDLHALPSIRYWIQDYYGIEARRQGPSLRQKLKAAPFAFSAPDWFGFFENLGFSPLETISTRQEALRTGRRPPFFSPMRLMMLRLSAGWQKKADSVMGYATLQRSER
jgi:methyltransferase (TIGR00027 family)